MFRFFIESITSNPYLTVKATVVGILYSLLEYSNTEPFVSDKLKWDMMSAWLDDYESCKHDPIWTRSFLTLTELCLFVEGDIDQDILDHCINLKLDSIIREIEDCDEEDIRNKASDLSQKIEKSTTDDMDFGGDGEKMYF